MGTMRRGLLAAMGLSLALGAAAEAPVSGLMFISGESMALLSPVGAACQPRYPPAALKAGVEGKTELNVFIDADGSIASAEVVRSAGDTPEHKLLDRTVALALLGCPMFRPKLDAEGHGVGYPLSLAFDWLLPSPDGKPRRPHPAHLVALTPACKPAYPPAALQARAEGWTRVRVWLDAAGHVISTEVVKSAGDTPAHKLLDETAAASFPRCPYTPATDVHGKPADAMLELNYVWKLQ